MTNIYKIASVVGLAAILNACTTDFDDSKDKGYLKMSPVSVNTTAENMTESRAVTDVDNFIVELYQDNEILQPTYLVNSFPEVLELPLGQYSVSVRNITLEDAAFDSPYYAASEDFEIKNNVITEVGPLVCRLSNIMVTVEVSPELRATLSAGSYVRVGYEKGEKLYFSLTNIQNGDAGYFKELTDGGKFEVSFTGVVDGETTTSTTYCENVKAGQHRIISYGLKDAENLTAAKRNVTAGNRIIVGQTVK